MQTIISVALLIGLQLTNSAQSFFENVDSESWYKPAVETTWQWQLSGNVNTNYDVDLYDIDLVETPQSTIDQLHEKDIKVICYFSAGSWEQYRSDAEDFPPEVLGEELDGWEDEKWLDISNYQKFSSIIQSRLDLAVEKKCDGVEPDNMDGYQNNSGFDLSYEDQITYNKWIATQAHDRKLSVALKNDLEQVEDLVEYFDFAINEECFQYDECELLTPFTKANKAVLGVEYELEKEAFCPQAKELNFSWLLMTYDLAGERSDCNY
jgi:hypothetical protein